MSIISQTFDEIERRHWESMSNEWEREKQKILNALIGQGQDTLDFPQDTEVKDYDWYLMFSFSDGLFRQGLNGTGTVNKTNIMSNTSYCNLNGTRITDYCKFPHKFTR